MSLKWSADVPPLWDADKERLVGQAPEGIFDRRYRSMKIGELVPGSWWRVSTEGRTLGFGWMDIVWGDAEILLVVDGDTRRQGVGDFILDNLAAEARSRGLNYLYNTVRPAHPFAEEVSKWLEKHGYSHSEDGSLLRASSAVRPG